MLLVSSLNGVSIEIIQFMKPFLPLSLSVTDTSAMAVPILVSSSRSAEAKLPLFQMSCHSDSTPQ